MAIFNSYVKLPEGILLKIRREIAVGPSFSKDRYRQTWVNPRKSWDNHPLHPVLWVFASAAIKNMKTGWWLTYLPL